VERDRLIEVNFINPVQDQIMLVEERMRAKMDGHHPTLDAAISHLLASGGKRIRVTLTLLTGGMLGAHIENLVSLAAAIESLHTATLVHDDLIDGALIRRGIPTLNAQWSPAATVLTGDFIFARAAQFAAETNSVSVMRLFAQTLATIVNGEVRQLFESRGNTSREDYYRRIYAKTASLFKAATASAAMLSSVSEDQVAIVGQYGYEVGMAFQIVDDILDYTGKQITMGKPVASDLRQGLITLPALYYIEGNPGDPDIKAILQNEYCDDDCIRRLVDAIRGSGAIQKALEEAQESIDRAVKLILEFPKTDERQALIDLARYIVSREI
jgi:geranylgeranyl pyrophosphate synthase